MLLTTIPQKHRGIPQAFISHAWSMELTVLVTGIEELQDVDYIWFDFLAVFQHMGAHQMEELKQLGPTVGSIGKTIMILDHKWTALSRSWCLFEVAISFQEKASFELVLAGLGKDDRWSSAENLSEVKTQKAQASMAEDKKNIDKLMLKQFGTYANADVFVRMKLYNAMHTKKIAMLKNLTERQRKALQKETYFKLFKDIREDGFKAQVTGIQDHVEKKTKEVVQVAKVEYSVTLDLVRKDKERQMNNIKELKAAKINSVLSSVNSFKGKQLWNAKKKMSALKTGNASKLLLGLKSGHLPNQKIRAGRDIGEEKDTLDDGDEKNNVIGDC